MGYRWRVLQALSLAPRGLIVALVLCNLTWSVQPAVVAVLTGRLIGAAQGRQPVVGWLVALCLVLALRETLIHTIDLINTTVGRRIDGGIRSEVRRHLATATDLGRAEDPAAIADGTLAATSGGPNGYVRSIGSGAFGLLQDAFQVLGAVISCALVASIWWPMGIVLLVLIMVVRSWQRRQQLAMAQGTGREAAGAVPAIGPTWPPAKLAPRNSGSSGSGSG